MDRRAFLAQASGGLLAASLVPVVGCGRVEDTQGKLQALADGDTFRVDVDIVPTSGFGDCQALTPSQLIELAEGRPVALRFPENHGGTYHELSLTEDHYRTIIAALMTGETASIAFTTTQVAGHTHSATIRTDRTRPSDEPRDVPVPAAQSGRES